MTSPKTDPILRDDPEIGMTRWCPKCEEWWPDDGDFFVYEKGRCRYTQCRACRAERVPKTQVALWQPVLDPRKDPLRAPALRARQARASARYYARHHTAVLEQRRKQYALPGPVREHFGRPIGSYSHKYTDV